MSLGAGASLMALTFSSVGCNPSADILCPKYSTDVREKHTCCVLGVAQQLVDKSGPGPRYSDDLLLKYL